MRLDRKGGNSENQPKQSRFYLWKFVIAGIAIPLAGIYLVLGSGEQLWRDAFLGICAGVIASAGWWSLFARYAESEARNLLGRELEDQRQLLGGTLSGLVLEVEREARQARDQNFPRAIYAPTDDFDLRFNRDLTRDFERSSFYYFAGPSAVWLPARVVDRRDDTNTPLREVKVKMVDPTSQIAISRAVTDRRRRRENELKSREQIETELRDHLMLSHIGLWSARSHVNGPICISYEGRSIIERLEMFENGFYDSNIERDDKERFPRTFAWSPVRSEYAARLADFHSESFAIFIIEQETSQEELERHLADLGLENGHWDYWIARYDREYRSRMRKGLELARAHVDCRELTKERVPDPR
ncbi:MAG TPA: hypothetical protein VFL77_06715 [Solirubrobacterales bacterium]|nr:hypothetical protein [Solirubrobacterales bacterium]